MLFNYFSSHASAQTLSAFAFFFCNLSFFPRIIHKLVLAKVSMPGAKYSGTVVGLRALGERGHQ